MLPQPQRCGIFVLCKFQAINVKRNVFFSPHHSKYKTAGEHCRSP
ncbi:conserved domain protein [Ruminococcus albus 8]|uniref:Conserved domain protein n=1 Tax=Ruminococcus albus 8 TaxID=246199 RepID=E9SGL2_RUMAL|nr:conserved domain protein [Ruminococcus albus 8]